MLLVLLAKILPGRVGNILPAALVAVLGLATGACVSSTEPILGDAKAIIGDSGQLHIYDVQDGATANHRSYSFQWNGRRYVVRDARAEISEFTVHAYEGRDFIVQARARRPLRPFVYALAHKLTDGVYRLTTIDAEDADDSTRNRFCIKTRDTPCRIETPEQLFVFARASANKESDGGRIAVLVRGKRR